MRKADISGVLGFHAPSESEEQLIRQTAAPKLRREIRGAGVQVAVVGAVLAVVAVPMVLGTQKEMLVVGAVTIAMLLLLVNRLRWRRQLKQTAEQVASGRYRVVWCTARKVKDTYENHPYAIVLGACQGGGTVSVPILATAHQRNGDQAGWRFLLIAVENGWVITVAETPRGAVCTT